MTCSRICSFACDPSLSIFSFIAYFKIMLIRDQIQVSVPASVKHPTGNLPSIQVFGDHSELSEKMHTDTERMYKLYTKRPAFETRNASAERQQYRHPFFFQKVKRSLPSRFLNLTRFTAMTNIQVQ